MKQPEALRLADELEEPIPKYPAPTALESAAAAELRRQNGEIESMRAERILDIKRIKHLHEANQAMLEALKELVAQTDGNFFTVSHSHVSLQKARAAIAKGETK